MVKCNEDNEKKTINQRLEALYWNTIGGDAHECTNKGLSYPLIIRFNDDKAVETADLRVMFFGQETLDWIQNPIASLGTVYCSFFNDFSEQPTFPFWPRQKSSSPFWRVIEQMKNTINERLSGKQISYIWNNIVKSDYKGYKGTADLYAEFKELNRKLILGEVEIIKPDVLVFFTGAESSGYDKVIDDVFGNGNAVPKDEIDIDGNDKILALARLPIYGDAYVSYHPRALELKPKAKDFVLDMIAKQCAKVIAK